MVLGLMEYNTYYYYNEIVAIVNIYGKQRIWWKPNVR
jgi:hypothetical protein